MDDSEDDADSDDDADSEDDTDPEARSAADEEDIQPEFPIYRLGQGESKILQIALAKRALDREEERKLLKKAQQGDTEAKNRIIKSSTLLAIKLAKKHPQQDQEELVVVAWDGVEKAIKKFDLRRSVRFLTYAKSFMKREIADYINRFSRSIRIPEKKMKKITKTSRVESELSQGTESPSLEDIADAAKMNVDEVRRLKELKSKANTKSLDEDFEGSEISDNDAEQGLFDPELFAELANSSDQLDRILCDPDLSDRECEVLLLRYGVRLQKPYPYAEVGKRLGITAQGAKYLEGKALKKARAIAKRLLKQDSVQAIDQSLSPVEPSILIKRTFNRSSERYASSLKPRLFFFVLDDLDHRQGVCGAADMRCRLMEKFRAIAESDKSEETTRVDPEGFAKTILDSLVQIRFIREAFNGTEFVIENEGALWLEKARREAQTGS